MELKRFRVKDHTYFPDDFGGRSLSMLLRVYVEGFEDVRRVLTGETVRDAHDTHLPSQTPSHRTPPVQWVQSHDDAFPRTPIKSILIFTYEGRVFVSLSV